MGEEALLAHTHPAMLAQKALLLSLLLLAQRQPPPLPREISGQVRAAEGDAPMREVMVRLESEGGALVDQTSTDSLGKFAFKNLGNSVYYITAHAPGYRDARQRVDLSVAARAFVQLHMISIPNQELAAPPLVVSAAAIPKEAISHIEKAKKYISRKEFDSAANHLEKALKIYPSSAEARFLLGTVKIDLGRIDEAERELRRAIELDQKLAGAYFALGDLYTLERRYAEAESVLLKGLSLDATSWQGHFALGKAYWAMGDAARAEPHAWKAHDLNPDFAQVHLLVGNILLRKREPELALAEFEDYLKREPKGPLANQVRQLVERIRSALGRRR